MSSQKPPVSVRDSKKIRIEISRPNVQNGGARPASSRNCIRRKTSKRVGRKSGTNLYAPRTADGGPNRERIIIRQKLQEIDELRAKIIQLQWALTSQEEEIYPRPQVKRSLCFPCLQFSSHKKVASDENDSKKTLDQMSTEVIFNSSRESLPKFDDYPEYSKPKKYRKRKNRRRALPEGEQCSRRAIEHKHGSNEQVRQVDKGVPSRAQSKVPNSNTIVIPELFSSNKNSNEDIAYLAEKLNAQSAEIRQIKHSLQECLDILRSKQDEERGVTQSLIKASMLSKSVVEDCIFMNQITPSIVSNFIKERESEVLNYLAPNTTQVFTCRECRHQHHHHHHRRRRNREPDDEKRCQRKATDSASSRCHESTSSILCQSRCRAVKCKKSKCCRVKRWKKCAKSKCHKSGCCKPCSPCSTCCAVPPSAGGKQEGCRPVVVKYEPRAAGCDECDIESLYGKRFERRKVGQVCATKSVDSERRRGDPSATESSDAYMLHRSRRRPMDDEKSGRGMERNSCCPCPPSKGCSPCDGRSNGPCPGKRRNGFLRCLLCLFCRNL